MKTFQQLIFTIGMIVLLLSLAARGQSGISASSVVNSPHNLSATGPGRIKASSEREVCIFCHTPHNSSVVQPLWNRELPEQAYRIYSSTTLISQPGQPTGSSKLCLSCHDGTIALGNVLSRSQPIDVMGATGGVIPAGSTNLGVDLSGDHPISFQYDANLSSRNGNLANPSRLPTSIHLENGAVQCTSCHDAHDNSRGKFLVMDNGQSQLCLSCHVRSGQSLITGHDQCADCHSSHRAPSGAMLLNQATVSATCLMCHGGSAPPPVQSAALAGATPAIKTALVQGTSVAGDSAKVSRHDVDNTVSFAAIRSTAKSTNATNSVNCADCHEPHTLSTSTGTTSAPLLRPEFGRIAGVTAQGTPIARARYEYEVCFKCHSSNWSSQPFITRKIIQPRISLQFALSAVSFHPVEGPGIARDVPSLMPPLTTSSIIYCTDCHNSDTGKTAGGQGTDGPHGSNIRPMLLAEYDTVDGSSESATAYALCYRCHNRASILNNDSFSRHSYYIVNQRTPCSVCHDSHGISSTQGTMTNNAHLINFDTSVVQPDPGTHMIQYTSTGTRAGTCTLSCHGKIHSGVHYP